MPKFEMKFPIKDTLTEEEVELGLRTVIKDGLTSQAMVTFMGGALLVAFALKLGASNFVIGLLAAIPPLMQLLQLPSIYLVEKIRNGRAISVYASTASRAMWLLIALTSVLLPPKAALTFLHRGAHTQRRPCCLVNVQLELLDAGSPTPRPAGLLLLKANEAVN